MEENKENSKRRGHRVRSMLVKVGLVWACLVVALTLAFVAFVPYTHTVAGRGYVGVGGRLVAVFPAKAARFAQRGSQVDIADDGTRGYRIRLSVDSLAAGPDGLTLFAILDDEERAAVGDSCAVALIVPNLSILQYAFK